MDVTTILGILIGLGLIGGSIMIGGSILPYLDLPSLLLTMGGTVAATIINYRGRQLTNALRIIGIAAGHRSFQPDELIRLIVRLAEKARREGLLAMEEEAETIRDPFLRRGIQLVVDGTDPELVRNIMDIELTFIEERHRQGQALFESLAVYAPAFGMIGTLVGLIRMLGKLHDPATVGPAMSLALLTTLYGALAAYLVFTPIAGKLRVKNDEEVMIREMMIEGVLSIQAGENPRIVEEKLRSFLPPARKEPARSARPQPGRATSTPPQPAVTSGARAR
ncbi:MotA/TolQ/ExbB proton channel family protein [Carboxydochorda subterranea]|uniref:MotA/TolQ/ExbB proton channel family protein n=1 Tax=Carboxydichorda subterranea TaxID=3109565 RepID=A0ABZ1C128_9FIRM|nr:MotA/TolQ/ExbB proton channel family protein [Limnochorda sp. L945t]WRP18456.1 MotA/TolQ/ExbB proton channel family protein [Limnochorda sp. L945t]